MTEYAGPTPFVTVVIPVRNEAGFIEELLRAVWAQDYPSDRMEVIVADGMSTDGTRDILTALQTEYPFVVIDNPAGIVSTGLNLAVARARGDVIVRVDGHALIAPDFLRQNVALLTEHPEAWCVGGPIRHTATTTFGRAVSVAMSHPMGVGSALHRYPEYEGYAEGAQFPAIRRWVFGRVGLFDERLVRNQDDEFNYRVTRSGGRVFISPRVRYLYFVRGRPGQLFRQYFQYGFWRIPVIAKHRRPTTARQVAPILFYSCCAVLGLAAAWWRMPFLGIALPAAYVASLSIPAASTLRRDGVRVALLVPLAIATMHAGYGLGMSYGFWARIFQPRAWEPKGSMATISR
jgi:glycosyltransferase involved in cell wall biosynthesis